MKKFNNIKNLIFFNCKPLVGFQLIYKTASVLIFVPLLWGLFDAVMKASGYSYLTLENIISFLTKPFTLLSLIGILFLATFYAMIDISAVVFTLDQSFQKNKVHFWQIVKFSIKNALRAWNPSNFLLIFVVLLLIPFLNIGMASNFIAAISIPEFIMDYIQNTPFLSFLFVLLVIFLSFLMMRWLYVFHYFTLEGCSFRQARKKSSTLSRKRRIRDFLLMLFMQTVFGFFHAVFIFLMVTLAGLVSHFFSGIFLLR